MEGSSATRQQLTFSPLHTIWPQQINFGPLGKEWNAAGHWLTHVMHFHCVKPMSGGRMIEKLEGLKLYLLQLQVIYRNVT